jgi:hypothetical protein
VPTRTDERLSGCDRSATGHRFGAHRPRDLLAARGNVGLWLADDGGDSSSETLLRLYPGLPTLGEWHTLKLAAFQRAHVVDARLVPIEQISLDVWPYVSFACSEAESLARRISREPMAPEAAVAMCADVAAALAALGRAGVPRVDVGPADIVLVGGRALLLPDVGLPGGRFAPACIDLDHVAPERAAVIATRAQGRPGDPHPIPESVTYALASIVSAAIQAPQPVGADPPPPQLEVVLRRALDQRVSARYRTPTALVAALGAAVGVLPSYSGASTPRATRARRASTPRTTPARQASAPRATSARGVRAAFAHRRTKPRGRSVGVSIPAAVVLAAAAIGAAAGSATTAPDPPAAVTLAGAGLSVEAPRGWLRGAGEDPPAIGGPALVAHPPGRSSAAALVVTRAAAPLLTELADAVPEPVRLGDHGAWRYRDVAVDAESVADVYVLEDGDGSIVAACLGPPGMPASVREECSVALTTLHLHTGPAAALGGDTAARRELVRVVEDLDRERERARRALAAAATGRRQAAAADRLATAYARAAAGAERTGTVGAPGELPRLVERLDETGRAYAALATAARATRRTAYTRARERVVAHERALHKDLAALSSARSGR